MDPVRHADIHANDPALPEQQEQMEMAEGENPAQHVDAPPNENPGVVEVDENLERALYYQTSGCMKVQCSVYLLRCVDGLAGAMT